MAELHLPQKHSISGHGDVIPKVCRTLQQNAPLWVEAYASTDEITYFQARRSMPLIDSAACLGQTGSPKVCDDLACTE